MKEKYYGIEKEKKKVGRPKNQKTIPFSEIKKYLANLDFNHTVYKSSVLREAERNNAPEEIIDLLLKLPSDRTWEFYFELQKSFNKIDQNPKPIEKEPEPIEKEFIRIKDELQQHKACLNDKNNRIERIENRYKMLAIACIITGIVMSYVLLTVFNLNIYNSLPETVFFDSQGNTILEESDFTLPISTTITFILSYVGLTLIYTIIYLLYDSRKD